MLCLCEHFRIRYSEGGKTWNIFLRGMTKINQTTLFKGQYSRTKTIFEANERLDHMGILEK